MSDNENQKNSTSPEFTPIGSKSGGVAENTMHTFSNMTPILKFTDRNTQTDTNANANFGRNFDLKGRYSSAESSRKPNSTSFTLRRSQARLSRNDDYDDILQSSSVASSIWEDELNERERADNPNNDPFSRRSADSANMEVPILNGKEKIRDDMIGDDSNMLKRQFDLLTKLQSENTNLKVEIVSLRQHLSGLPSDSATLIDENISLNKRIVQLENLLRDNGNEARDDLKSKVREYSERLDSLHRDYDNVLKEKEQLIHDSFNKETELKKLQKSYDELQDDYEKVVHLQGTVEKLDAENQELQDRLDDQMEKYSKLQNEHDQISHSHELSKLNSEIDRLEDANLELQRELDKVSQEKENLETRYENLKGEIEQHDLDNEKVTHSPSPNNSFVITDMQAEIDALKDRLSAAETEKRTLQQKYDRDIRLSYHSSREKVEDMTKRLEESLKTIDGLDEQLSDKENENLTLHQEIKQLNLQIESLQRKNKLLNDQLNHLKDNNSDSTKLLTKEVGDLYDKIEDYETVVQKLKSRIKDLEDSSLENRAEYLRDLEDDKNQLYESLVETEKIIKEKDSEIASLKLQLSSTENKEREEYVKVDDLIKVKEHVERERLEHENEINTLVEESRKKIESLIDEIEKLEDSKDKLIETYEDLRNEYENLQTKYEELVNSAEVEELSNDLAKITIEYKRSQDENDQLIKEYSSEVEILNEQLKLKDYDISRLRDELQNKHPLNTESINTKLNSLEETIRNITDKKEEIEKLKIALEDENLLLKNENNRLKTKENKVAENLKEFEEDNNRLLAEMKSKKVEIEQLNREILQLSSRNRQLERLNGRLTNEQDEILIETSKASNTVSQRDTDNSMKLREYELKLQEKTNQYNNIVEEYNYMKNDLIERLKDMKKEIKSQGQNSQEEIRQWKDRYEKTNEKLKVSERHLDILKKELKAVNEELENERERDLGRMDEPWYPPTPESPSREIDETMLNKLKILKLQKDMLMIKLNERNEKVSDLKYMLGYLRLEVEKKNEMIKRNKGLLQTVGVKEDDATIRDPVRKLRVYFLTVLSGIRFKNRLNEIKKRNQQVLRLKSDIKLSKRNV
ncbi:uncharacterized protein C5L36_0E00330 [Pichia kudriavzevii]|uniref:Spindle pole body component 110 n=1 Tax=Pichia kudriavzevii TaxID=4909 RepID=A0A2U9R957_PICKU|nr:uncharacterized protein C5L36_0E00330 [Pichia kudriavzevii]AWU77964.1 hypothetical protein C5L36_0E00330 [Pichia kudriavzevii]